MIGAAGGFHDRGKAVDDAFISYRYAENLAHGHGLRWNPGSAPCEGYTNLLYVLLLAGGSALGIEPPTTGSVIGVASTVVTILLIASVFGLRAWWAPIACAGVLLLLAREELRVHASRGLETPLFGALAVAQSMIAGWLARRPMHSWPGALLLAVLSLLLCLCRPDGALIAATTWLVVLGVHLARRALRSRIDLVAGAAAAAALLTAYGIWKYCYFGYLLPNAFYMKAAQHGWNGVADTLRFFSAYRWALLVGLSGCAAHALIVGRRSRGRQTHRTIGLAPELQPAIALVATFLWAIYNCRIVHEMGFGFRFEYPIVPLIAAGFAVAVRDVCRELKPGYWARAGALAVGLCALAVVTPRVSYEVRQLTQPRPVDRYVTKFRRLGLAIREVAGGRTITLFSGHAGATPYYSGVNHVDPLGLVDDGFCVRTPEADRRRYKEQLRLDIISSSLFPASAGAATFEDDARALQSTYLHQWCLGLKDDNDALARHRAATKLLTARKADLHARMRQLRDECTFIGEMSNGIPRWREFIYVVKASSFHDDLATGLRRHIDIPAELVIYDGWPDQ